MLLLLPLLAEDVLHAREALGQRRNHAAAETRLERALREGSGTVVLAKAVQEAAAAGVKVCVWGRGGAPEP